MARETVFIVDPIHDAGVQRIGGTHDVILPDQGLADPRIPQTSMIVVRTTDLGDDLFARMPKLKLIVKHGAGVDNIDMKAATQRGILVTNTPGGNNSTAVAEGAVTLMLAVLRRVRDMDALVRDGRFNERWKVRLGDLTSARVGFIGFGRIARAAAKICGAGFGCKIAAYDPVIRPEEMRALGAEPVTLAEVLKRDIISIHTPLIDSTRNLIGAAELAQMQRHAIIINTSRGGIIDEAALVGALKSNSIAGAGIDVFEREPPPKDHPLFALPNVVLGPHVAGVTEASMKGMAFACADVIDAVTAGRQPETLLNKEVLRS
jgi:phosphoglycerate dehydrogenase-like enzyme